MSIDICVSKQQKVDEAVIAVRRALRLGNRSIERVRELHGLVRETDHFAMLLNSAAEEALIGADEGRAFTADMVRAVTGTKSPDPKAARAERRQWGIESARRGLDNWQHEANIAREAGDDAKAAEADGFVAIFAGMLQHAETASDDEWFNDLPHEPPEIQVEPGELTAQVNAAERALMRADLRLFQHAGRLVRLGWVDTGDTEQLRIVPVEEPHLLELIGRVSRWLKRDARSRGYVQCSPPREVAAAYLARGGIEWRVPRLNAVIEATTLREDGSILAQPGYDEETGLFLAPGDCSVFPGCQGKDMAVHALWTLHDLLDEFPFVTEADQSVALAAILTATIRRALPTSPLFAFTAPAPGTGKSMLADLVAMISTGKPARSFTWTGDPAEDRKALDAALLEGAPLISLDNVTAPLGGDRLNQLLTQGGARVRVLGESRTVEVACDALVLANGNNLAIAADLTRRTMLCRLDAGVERPELRTFYTNPLKMVECDRGRYLHAALTILQAYHAAGRPAQPGPLGSFDAWSGWVRGALLWLGQADPVDTQETARQVDPRGAELLAVLGQWNEHIGDRHVTSRQLIDAAVSHAEFHEAMLGVAGRAGAINTIALGKWLHANKDRVVGQLRIESAGKSRTGVALWFLSGGRRACGIARLDGTEFTDAAD